MASLLEFIRSKNIKDETVFTIMNIVGIDDSIIYLEKILKAIRIGKIQFNSLNDNSQVFWLMEYFGYGLTLSFKYFEIINEIILIYANWLCAIKLNNTKSLEPFESLSIPLPLIYNFDIFCHKIIDQFTNVFLNRKTDNNDYIGYQAMACIQIIMAINTITVSMTDFNLYSSSNTDKTIESISLNESNDNSKCDMTTIQHAPNKCIEMNPELWEHILIFLLKVNDTILNNQTNKQEGNLVLANFVGSHSIKLLFDVWIRSGSSYFPSPVFWNTLSHLCKTFWKYEYLPLIEHWTNSIINLSLALLKFNQPIDEKPIISFNLLSQYWYKILKIIGNPEDLIYYTYLNFNNIYKIRFSDSINNMDITKDVSYDISTVESFKKLQAILFPNFYNNSSNFNNNVDRNDLELTIKLLQYQMEHFKGLEMKTKEYLNKHFHLISLIYVTYITGISKIVHLFLDGDLKSFSNESYNTLQPKLLSSQQHLMLKSRSPTPPLPPPNPNPSTTFLPKKKVSHKEQSLLKQSSNNHPISTSFSSYILKYPPPPPTINQTNIRSSQRSTTSKDFNNQNITSSLFNQQQPPIELNNYQLNSLKKEFVEGNHSPNNSIKYCNSLFKIFGDCLFNCASLNTELNPFKEQIYFSYAKAEACGSLCHIMSHLNTIINPSSYSSANSLSNFIYIIYYNLMNENVEGLDIVRTCILINSSNLFRNTYLIPGINILVSPYLKLIKIALNFLNSSYKDSKTKYSIISHTSISNESIINSCIDILSSVWALPTFGPNITLINMSLKLDEKSLNYSIFRKPIIDLIINELEQGNPLNIQKLIAIITIILQDLAIYQMELLNNFQDNIPPCATLLKSYLPSTLSIQTTKDNIIDMNNHNNENHFYWCFDCLFHKIIQIIINILANNINEDISICMDALSCLSCIAKINILIYKPVCEDIITKLIKMIKLMCQQQPHDNDNSNTNNQDNIRIDMKRRHSRDYHTLIVHFYSCICDWICYHPNLIIHNSSSSIIDDLINVCELGITGSTSPPSPSNTININYKWNNKQFYPISKRVANSAEMLFINILTIQNKDELKNEESFSLQNEMALLSSSPKSTDNTNIKYISIQQLNTMFGFIQQKSCLNDSRKNYLVIYNGYSGRDVWDINMNHTIHNHYLNKENKNNKIDTFDEIKIIRNDFESVNKDLNEDDCLLNMKLKSQNYKDIISPTYTIPHLDVDNEDIFNYNNNNLIHYPVIDQANNDYLDFDKFDNYFKHQLSYFDNKLNKNDAKTTTKYNHHLNKPYNDSNNPFNIYNIDPDNLIYQSPKVIENIDIFCYYLTSIGYWDYDFFFQTNNNTNVVEDEYYNVVNSHEINEEDMISMFNPFSNPQIMITNFMQSLYKLNSIENRPTEIIFCSSYSSNDNEHDLFPFFGTQTLPLNQSINKMFERKYNNFLHKLGSYVEESSLGYKYIEFNEPFWRLLFLIKSSSPLKETEDKSVIKHEDFISSISELISHLLFNINSDNLDNIGNKKESSLSSIDTTNDVTKMKRSSQLICETLQPKIMYFILWTEDWLGYNIAILERLNKIINDPNYNDAIEERLNCSNYKDICLFLIHPIECGLIRINIQTTYKARTGSMHFPLIQDMLINERCLLPVIKDVIMNISKNKKYECESLNQTSFIRKQEIQNMAKTYFQSTKNLFTL